MTEGRARTVFIGSGGFGRETLWRLADHPDVELVGVVTAPPRPAGRGGRTAVTPIHEAARHLEIRSILTPARLRDRGALEAVSRLAPDLVVLADYGQIVPSALLDLRHGALNMHPSLLPRFRGATPIPAAILAGDDETGVTLMRMDAGLDTGPIVAQARVALAGDETTPLLEETLEVEAAELLTRYVGPWLRGKISATPQSDEGATMTRPLRREDGRLDPALPAGALERQVRAYQPWPGSFVDTDAGRLIVWRAEVEPDGPSSGVFDEHGLGTGDGSRLRLREVQPAGRDRMSWDAYLRGRPSIVGSSIAR
ncbi:MAG TPA: methionyl-tRNA formyltransferase [Candidatus Limnocylindrales bacterium]|nr:methionyl-tRNA formyltransferase [Candidatus Limnocylindrales bacterium]